MLKCLDFFIKYFEYKLITNRTVYKKQIQLFPYILTTITINMAAGSKTTGEMNGTISIKDLQNCLALIAVNDTSFVIT